MFVPATFSVVGVKTDGTRVVVSRNESLETAERVLHMVQPGNGYQDIQIEEESKSGKMRRRSPKPR